MWQIVTDEKGFRANAAEKVTPCAGQLKQSGNKSWRVYAAAVIEVLQNFVLLRIVQVGVKRQDASLR